MSDLQGPGMCREAGVYERRVIGPDGSELEIAVPRFLCRGLGPRPRSARTFSVLPAEVMPRRRWSVGWMLQVALWCSTALEEALDQLSEAGMVVEAQQLRRVLQVLGIVCERLHQHPVPGLKIDPVGGRRRDQAFVLVDACSRWKALGHGPPGRLVMAWNRRYEQLLGDIRVS